MVLKERGVCRSVRSKVNEFGTSIRHMNEKCLVDENGRHLNRV